MQWYSMGMTWWAALGRFTEMPLHFPRSLKGARMRGTNVQYSAFMRRLKWFIVIAERAHIRGPTDPQSGFPPLTVHACSICLTCCKLEKSIKSKAFSLYV